MKSPHANKNMALLLVVALALSPAAAFAAPTGAEGITRGEFAALLNAALSLPDGEGAGYLDVPAEHAHAADILAAQAAGYMKGDGDGNFRPDEIISGAEAAVCADFFLGFDHDKVEPNALTAAPPWANGAVSTLLDLGMVPLGLADKEALTADDAQSFVAAITTAAMFQGSPYALGQADENDDFYAYNNRRYLATATVRAGNIYAMAFMEPELEVESQSAELLAEILARGGGPGSDEWKIGELHKMYMDEPGRAKSVERIKPYIEKIKAVDSIAGLNALAMELYPELSIQGFYGIAASSDAKADATKWCAIIMPGAFLLGSRDYYADDPSLAPVHEEEKKLIAAVLAYVGETDGLDSRADAMFAMEKGSALASMPLDQLNNPDVIYTKSSWDDMDKAASGSNTPSYSPELRDVLKDANVYCPDIDYIKHVEALYTEENLATLKDFAIFNVAVAFGGLLGDDFATLSDGLQAALFGEAVEKRSMELRAQDLVLSLMGDAFSKLYADRFSSPGDKADVAQIVELIRSKYRERLAGLSWMGEGTKAKAIEKLDAIKAYVAYPDSYRPRNSFDMEGSDGGGSLIDAYMGYLHATIEQQLDDLSKPFAYNLWDSVKTYTVNAYYSATENAIIVPAGILQEPFYARGGDREANLGALGAVIAHEFSHAFDNNGAKYDKNGTLANWWADSDNAAFNEMTGSVADALSAIEFVGGQSVNGVLCTGETIADLGAMACILDIADDADGADMAAVMRSWAHIWAARMSPEVAAFLLAMDTHAPSKVRANFVLSMQGSFYDTFGVTESDGMYVPPEDRIAIW